MLPRYAVSEGADDVQIDFGPEGVARVPGLTPEGHRSRVYSAEGIAAGRNLGPATPGGNALDRRSPTFSRAEITEVREPGSYGRA